MKDKNLFIAEICEETYKPIEYTPPKNLMLFESEYNPINPNGRFVHFNTGYTTDWGSINAGSISATANDVQATLDDHIQQRVQETLDEMTRRLTQELNSSTSQLMESINSVNSTTTDIWNSFQDIRNYVNNSYSQLASHPDINFQTTREHNRRIHASLDQVDAYINSHRDKPQPPTIKSSCCSLGKCKCGSGYKGINPLVHRKCLQPNCSNYYKGSHSEDYNEDYQEFLYYSGVWCP